MAGSASLPRLALRDSGKGKPRHSVVVRLTHWIHTAAFSALVVSGIAVLLAHPRLYWGETGAVGTPSLFDLPLPFVLTGQSGWGRYLHFLAAWVCVLNGLLYVGHGVTRRHFRENFAPAKGDFSAGVILREISRHLQSRRSAPESYNVLQRITYVAVVFMLFPLIIATGLAMSPALTSVFPLLVNVFGGQQSARTVHFFVASALIVFLLVHVTIVASSGFAGRMAAMIIGGRKELP